MSRVLMPINNSTWGVIVHQVAPNEYEHVLSFENEQVKAQFIGQELFNDRNYDYRVAIERGYETKLIKISSTKASMSVNLSMLNSKQGTNFNIDDILNVDMFIIEDNNKIQFWTVDSCIRAGNNETFNIDLSLDVMFNVIDELDISGDVFIERAHTKRYTLVNNIPKFLRTDNIKYEMELENYTPYKVTDLLPLHLAPGLADSTINLLDDITWLVMFKKVDSKDNGVIFNNTPFYQYNPDNDNYDQIDKYDHFPYEIHIVPVDFYSDNKLFFNVYIPGNPNKYPLGMNFYKTFRDDANTLSMFYIDGSLLWDIIDKITPFYDGENLIGYDILLKDLESYPYSIFNYLTETVEDGTDVEYYSIRIDDLTRLPVFSPLEFQYLNYPNPTTYNEYKDISNEVKLNISQFKKLEMWSREGVEGEIKREFLLNDSEGTLIGEKIELFYSISFQPEFINEFYFCNNDTLMNWVDNKYGILKTGDYSLPLGNDLYNQYLTTHKTTSKTGYKSGLVKGAIGGALVAGGEGAVFGAIAGGIIGGLKHYTNLNDLKKSPIKPTEQTNTYGLDRIVKDKPYIRVVELSDEYLKYVYDHLYKYGYTIERLGKISDFINNRYYFNYIKTENIFSNIKNRYSGEIKQIINDSFVNGFTIWHVRDVNTFKGICNYEYENQEMSLINEDTKLLQKNKSK